MTEEKVDGGGSVWNEDGLGVAERSGKEMERVEDADYDGRQDYSNRRHKVTRSANVVIDVIVTCHKGQFEVLTRNTSEISFCISN